MWVTRDSIEGFYNPNQLKIWVNKEPIKSNCGFWFKGNRDELADNDDFIKIPEHEKWKNVKWSDSEATRLTDGLEIEK